MVEVYVNYVSQTLFLSYTLCTGITQDSRGAQSLQALVSFITQSAEKAVLLLLSSSASSSYCCSHSVQQFTRNYAIHAGHAGWTAGRGMMKSSKTVTFDVNEGSTLVIVPNLPNQD